MITFFLSPKGLGTTQLHQTPRYQASVCLSVSEWSLSLPHGVSLCWSLSLSLMVSLCAGVSLCWCLSGQVFSVRSMGWVEVPEEALFPGRSSLTVNNIIQQLSHPRSSDQTHCQGPWGEVP